MSLSLVQTFLNDLNRLQKISGSLNEQTIREAFKDVLKNWSRQNGLLFVAELEFATGQKTKVYPDGAILHDIRVALGYWEAKDTKDDLEEEIRKKFAKGYPQDNIIFENSVDAVLIQNRNEVFRCKMLDVNNLLKLLNLFFSYERAEIFEFRKAVEQFKADLPHVLEALRERIDTAYATNDSFKIVAETFLEHVKQTVNPALTEADVRDMLIQHILTEEIFTQVFNDGQFHRENNIAKELYKLEAAFFTGAVKREALKAIETYYATIRSNAALITGHGEKQKFLKVIYENFYKVYDRKAADRLGVVYTPNEIVKFMIEGADWLCQTHFGKALIDPGVEILDPATGTGTFICELIEHFRGQPAKLAHKYKNELHANEVAILPYYVANLNIEATYAAVSGQFAEFPNLCFVDTLDNVAGLGIRAGYQHDIFSGLSDENIARVKRQNAKKISVIIGNPPYNAWQENFNMRNPNRAYKRVDERIKDSYISKGKAQNKNSVYDMYTRFFRWASDRLHDDGVIAFITNRNFIEKAAFDGFRRDLGDEFNDVYVVDLGGDVRANPKLSGTKNNVFGIQTGVTIVFCLKRHKQKGCKINYVRRPEFDTAEDKLNWLSSKQLANVKFERVEPDKNANWLNITDDDWDSLLPIATKEAKARKQGQKAQAIFQLFSRGLETYRDDWIYDFDKNTVDEKMRFFVETYNKIAIDGQFEREFEIKWDYKTDSLRSKKIRIAYDQTKIGIVSFRPFVEKFAMIDWPLNGRVGMFPETIMNGQANSFISFLGMASSNEVAVFSTRRVFDLCQLKFGNGGTQGVPRYRYTKSGEKIDNITDWALEAFQKRYGRAPTSPLAGEDVAKRQERGNVSTSAKSPLSVAEDGDISPSRGEIKKEASSVAEDGGISPARGEIKKEASSVAEDGDISPARGENDIAAALTPTPNPSPQGGGEKKAITKDAIFHYVYGVLHDPLYREKYAINLKREFPRIPFYDDFWLWAAWGEKLMALHIGYEDVEPWPLTCHDTPDTKRIAAGVAPRPVLKSDPENGMIKIDAETVLSGIPRAAWDYRLGNRSGLDWVLDQYKEKTPKDPTIREKFNTYRFADYKEKVIDLLARVARVSVETVEITEAMRAAKR